MINRCFISTRYIDKFKTVENNVVITPYFSEYNFSSNHLLCCIDRNLNHTDYPYLLKNCTLWASANIKIKKVCKGSNLTIFNYLTLMSVLKIKKIIVCTMLRIFILNQIIKA